MPTDDQSLPPSLQKRLQALDQRNEAAQRRVSNRGPEPLLGDVYALPMPIPGPSQWCVVHVGGSGSVGLAPVDDRPFFGASDLWVSAHGSDVCLRVSCRCELPSESLLPSHRINHLDDIAVGLGADEPAEASLTQPTDPVEVVWRSQLARASRLLPRWAQQRVLSLRLSDLCDEQDFQRERTLPSAHQQPLHRLAAASGGAGGAFDRAVAAGEQSLRWEEVYCAGGRLVLVVSPRGFGFLFEPEADAVAPRLLWGSPSACSTPVEWQSDRDRSALRAFLAHDWLRSRAVVEVQSAVPFRVEIDNAGYWS